MQWPVFRVAVIEPSMIPAVYPGDWLLVLRARHPARIRPGCLVIAINPEDEDMLLVKRAARRVAGDGTEVGREGAEAGREIAEVARDRAEAGREGAEVARDRAEDGGWWLSSDNPYAGAVDSSRFGPVPDRLILGRVLARYWPPRR